MTSLEQTRLFRLFEHVPRAASAVAIAVGSLVLFGWVFNLALLKSVISGLVAMKANTALGFVLAGISLWAATAPRARGRLPLAVARFCGGAVLLLGLLVLAEYLIGADFGIDQLLVRETTTFHGSIPGRMAFSTAACFAALGCALVLLSREKGGSAPVVHVLTAVPILVAGAALVSYGYDIEAFLRVKLNYTPMALHTAAVFVVLGLGVISARPDYPFRRIMTSDGAAGSTARRLLPAAVGFQLAMGWLLLIGLQAGYLSAAVGQALFVVANIGGLGALIHWNAALLYRAEAQRKQAEEALRKSSDLMNTTQRLSKIGGWEFDVATGRSKWTEELYRLHDLPVDSDMDHVEESLKSYRPEDRTIISNAFNNAAEKGEAYDLEFPFMTFKGRALWVRTTGQPVYENGKVVRVIGNLMDITERRRADDALKQASAYTRSLIEASLDPLVTISAEGKIMDVNLATERVTGRSQRQLIGSDFSDYFTEPEKARQGYQRVLAQGFVRDYPLAIRNVSGDVTEVLYHATVFKNEAGKVQGVFAAARDITERKRAEEALQESEERYRSVIAALFEGVLLLDADGAIRASNASAERTLGLTVDQLAGRTPFDPRWRAIHEDGSPFPAETHPTWVTLQTGEPCRDVVMGVNKPDGSLTWVSINTRPLYRPNNAKPYAVAASFADITERKRVEEELRALQSQLREQATRDPLTGLYNRRYLEETLRRELARAEREGHPLNILMVDVDYFKRLNDTYGHPAGDEVLRLLGGLLQHHARSSDIPCRYGGEEFVVVLPDMPLEAVRERAELMRRDFADSRIAFGGSEIVTTLSIGVSSYPSHGQTADQLIRAADLALYEAKRSGRNRVCYAGLADIR